MGPKSFVSESLTLLEAMDRLFISPFSQCLTLQSQETINQWADPGKRNIVLSFLQYVAERVQSDVRNANSTKPDARMVKVEKYIAEHYNQVIRLSEVAGLVGLSNEACCRLIAKQKGMGLIDYIHQVRVNRAACLLLHTNETICSVGYQCGFNTPANFNDIFKKVKGMTPGEYRKKGIV